MQDTKQMGCIIFMLSKTLICLIADFVLVTKQPELFVDLITYLRKLISFNRLARFLVLVTTRKYYHTLNRSLNSSVDRLF